MAFCPAVVPTLMALPASEGTGTGAEGMGEEGTGEEGTGTGRLGSWKPARKNTPAASPARPRILIFMGSALLPE